MSRREAESGVAAAALANRCSSGQPLRVRTGSGGMQEPARRAGLLLIAGVYTVIVLFAC